MKKVLLFVLVLFLAVPALSFAGSATSRWDLTIGGFVKVDAGYVNQAAGPSPAGLEEYFADRDNYLGNQNASNKGGSFGMAAGQTSLNFLVKGPDTWGAKTTAFVQGNFVGQTTNSGVAGTKYGTFTLSHAYMDFTWATTKLMVGYNWQSWGFLPTYNFLGLYDLLLGGRGNTVPQITITQTMAKSFYGTFGIQEPYNMRDQTGGSANLGQALPPTSTTIPSTATGQNNTTARVTSEIPDVVAELGYKSDACGKIGPNMLQFAVGGMLGQDKVIFLDPTSTKTYSTNNVPRWAAAFKAYVPIIPEKNLNKAGALSVSGSIWTGQNLSNFFLGARAIGSPIPYNEASNASTSTQRNYGVPVTTGAWGQIQFYFTDKVYFNGLYAWLTNNVSSYYRDLFPNQIKQNQQYIGNILYDVNPAVRVGLEYSYIKTGFDGFGLNNGGNGGGAIASPGGQLTGYTGTLLGTSGSVQCARIAFWYFF